MNLKGMLLYSNFTKYWLAYTISLFGTAVSNLALPLTAVLFLQASPSQMGTLMAIQQAPVVLFSLFIGVWIDGADRKLVIVSLDLLLAFAVISIPVMFFFGLLTFPYLCTIGFFIGSFQLISRLARASFIPSILPTTDFLDGNTKLHGSLSISNVAGPAIAGSILQVVAAPIALIIDAISFLVSAIFINSLDVEDKITKDVKKNNFWKDLWEGISFLFANKAFRIMTVSSIFATLGAMMQQAVLIWFLTNQLNYPSATIGIICSSLGMAAVAGVFIAKFLTNRIDSVAAVKLGTLIPCVGMLLIPLSAYVSNPLYLLVLANTLIGLGAPMYYINETTLRQLFVRNEMLGRITSSRSFIAGGMSPIGAILGGVIAQRTTSTFSLLCGALCMAIAAALILLVNTEDLGSENK